MDTNVNTDDAAKETVQKPDHMPIENSSICVTNDEDKAQETEQNSDTTIDITGNTITREMVLNADNRSTESPTTAVTAIDIEAVANIESDNSSDVSVIDSDEIRQIQCYYRYRVFIMFLQLLNLLFALYQMLAVGLNWHCIAYMFSDQNYRVFCTLVNVSDIIRFFVLLSVFLSSLVGIIGYCTYNLALILIYALLMVVISAGCLALSQYVFGGYTLVVSVLACVYVYVFLFHVRRDLRPSNREQRSEELGADAPSL